MTRQELLISKLEKEGLIAIHFRYKKIDFCYKSSTGMFYNYIIKDTSQADVEFIQDYYRTTGDPGDDAERNMLALANCVSKKVGVAMRICDEAYKQYQEAYKQMLVVLKDKHVVTMEASDNTDIIEVLIKEEDGFTIKHLPFTSLQLIQEYYKNDTCGEFKDMLRFMDLVQQDVPEDVICIGYVATKDQEAYEQYRAEKDNNVIL